MLEIYTRAEGPPIMCAVELERLLHDVRVVQGVPFLELDDGLLNLTEVVRIIEATPDTGPSPLTGILHSCAHGYIGGTCSACKAIADVEAQQP